MDGGSGFAGGAAARHDRHDGGAGGVAYQAEPEQGEVLAVEVAGAALCEHADGVEDERGGDGDAGDHEKR